MSKHLKKVINLSKKTGDRIIVFDNNEPENSFVLMTLDQYEDLISDDPKDDKNDKNNFEKKDDVVSEENNVKKDDAIANEEDNIKKDDSDLNNINRDDSVRNDFLKNDFTKNDFTKDRFDKNNFNKDDFVEDKIDRSESDEVDFSKNGFSKNEGVLEGRENQNNFQQKNNISEGPLKETLRNLLTEKKIVDKIDDIEKNNANLKNGNGFQGNNWRIPSDIKEDSE